LPRALVSASVFVVVRPVRLWTVFRFCFSHHRFTYNPRGAQNVHNPRPKPQEQEHNQPPGRRFEQFVETPPQGSADNNAGNKITAQTKRMPVTGDRFVFAMPGTGLSITQFPTQRIKTVRKLIFVRIFRNRYIFVRLVPARHCDPFPRRYRTVSRVPQTSPKAPQIRAHISQGAIPCQGLFSAG